MNALQSKTKPLALVLDPDPATQSRLAKLLEDLGFEAVRASTGAEAADKLSRVTPSVLLIDVAPPDMAGSVVLHHARERAPNAPVFLLATSSTLRSAIDAKPAGVTEVLDKSAAPETLHKLIDAILASPGRRISPGDQNSFERHRGDFFGHYEQLFRRSERMRAVEKLVVDLAKTDTTVLILGEPGAGKGLVAKALHYLSDRSAKPWATVNCAALPPDLVETEIFGSVPNGETAAIAKLENVAGGTLFVNEIGELPLALQARLHHLLQHGEFFPTGSREPRRVDIRIVAGSSRDLDALVRNGSFREDLYKRFDVQVTVPPLRERREEIASLAEYFRQKFSQQFGHETTELPPDVRMLLVAYSWPGNVRELENLIKRYVVLGDEHSLRAELQTRLRLLDSQQGLAQSLPAGPLAVGLREIARRAAREAEIAAIKIVLEGVQWNRAEAARLLRISYKTLLNKLKQEGFARKPRSPRKRNGDADNK
jgi:two-component system response regulator AtoC